MLITVRYKVAGQTADY